MYIAQNRFHSAIDNITYLYQIIKHIIFLEHQLLIYYDIESMTVKNTEL